MKDVITELQDMRYLSWTKTRKSSGTAGSFLKSYDDTWEKKRYYKLSDFDPVKGVVGHECINEIIVQRLLRHFNIEHLEYKLIHALIEVDYYEYETWLCESEDFKTPFESKLPLEDFYLANKLDGESPFEFCCRYGWCDAIYGMLVIDYLILNRDRHGANIEVLRSQKEHTLRLAPLFDHGLSFACRCHDEKELRSFDVMKDLRVQAFIGTNSVEENMRLVPKDFIASLPPVDHMFKHELLKDLGYAISEPYLDKIWEMIIRRWEKLGNI